MCVAPALCLAPAATGQGATPPDRIGSAAQSRSSALEVTLKFTDASVTAGIVKAFWSDPAAAREAFDRLKVKWPAMNPAKLDRVTYSDELVLLFPCDQACSLNRTKAGRDLVSTLAAIPGIAYVEAELTVQIQAPSR